MKSQVPGPLHDEFEEPEELLDDCTELDEAEDAEEVGGELEELEGLGRPDDPDEIDDEDKLEESGMMVILKVDFRDRRSTASPFNQISRLEDIVVS